MENHQQEQEEQHQFLPYEILTDILSRLPADSTIGFKLVCKAWRSIIEEDSDFHDMCLRQVISLGDNNCSSASTTTTSSSLGFVALETAKKFCFYTHHVCFAEYQQDDQKVMDFKKWRLPFKDHSPGIHENLTVVGSSNGLICISVIRPNYYSNPNPSHHQTFVCNPLTGEVVNLSSVDSSIDSSLSLVRIGFGYLPSTNEYKIVRIYSSGQMEGQMEGRIKHVQVYTLGRGCGWRTIVPHVSWSDITLSISYSIIREVSKLGISVNGALYFNNSRNIVSFDLATEEFRIIVLPLPPPPPFTTNNGIGGLGVWGWEPPCTTDSGIGGLGVLGGRLCATYNSSKRLISSTSSIITSDLWVLMDDKEDFPWIKKFSLQSNPSLMKGIVSYNPETDHLCCRDNIDGDRHIVIPYVKSCVSLKALGEPLQGKI